MRAGGEGGSVHSFRLLRDGGEEGEEGIETWRGGRLAGYRTWDRQGEDRCYRGQCWFGMRGGWDNRGRGVALTIGEIGRIIARGGSSNPGLCISHTGAAGAPCSGRTHPGRPASLEDAVEEQQRRG